MKAVGFKESNHVLGKPQDMTDEECDQLPIFTDGRHCISCWKLTPEELELVQQTGCVYVGILSGYTQPPIFIQVDPPFVKQ